MRFDISNEPAISDLYAFSKNFRIFSEGYRYWYCGELYNEKAYIRKDNFIERISKKYCDYNGIEYTSEKQGRVALHEFDIRCYKKVFTDFNVELISSRFENEVKCSGAQLYKLFKGKSIYDIVGDCNGIFVFSEVVVLYCVSSEGAYFDIYNRYNPSKYNFFFYQFGNGNIFKEEVNGVCNESLGLFTLIFKKYTEVRSQLIGANVRRASFDGDEMLLNKAPFKIKQTDCTWFTTYYTDEKIPVRGFWRWQACGVRYSEHKLIYVPPFVKNGYHRRAKMLNCA